MSGSNLDLMVLTPLESIPSSVGVIITTEKEAVEQHNGF
jgi:hypothetical protein